MTFKKEPKGQGYFVCLEILLIFEFFLLSVKATDYFDTGIMDRLSDQVTCITDKTQIDLNGSTDSVTFHSQVSNTPTNCHQWQHRFRHIPQAGK